MATMPLEAMVYTAVVQTGTAIVWMAGTVQELSDRMELMTRHGDITGDVTEHASYN